MRTPRLRPDGASPREIAFVANQLLLGRLNTHGEITLEAGSGSTSLSRPYISAGSVLVLVPATANAAAAQATLWIVCDEGEAVLHHANNSQTDRTFAFAVFGG